MVYDNLISNEACSLLKIITSLNLSQIKIDNIFHFRNIYLKSLKISVYFNINILYYKCSFFFSFFLIKYLLFKKLKII